MSLTHKQKVGILVYVGNYGTYEIPPELYESLNPIKEGRSIFDRRTKHGKLVNQWGKEQDIIRRSEYAANK